MLFAVICQNGYLIIAGHTAARKLNSFAMIPVSSLSMSLATFVSQNKGADQKERIREGVIKSNEKEKKSSWQLDSKAKAKIQEETAKIGKNSKTNSQARTTKISDCEQTK